MINVKEKISIPKKYITENGVVVLPLEVYEKLQEDVEMLYGEKLADEIEKSRNEIKEGKTLTITELRKAIS